MLCQVNLIKDLIGKERILDLVVGEGLGKIFGDFEMFYWSIEGMNKFCGSEGSCEVRKVDRG